MCVIIFFPSSNPTKNILIFFLSPYNTKLHQFIDLIKTKNPTLYTSHFDRHSFFSFPPWVPCLYLLSLMPLLTTTPCLPCSCFESLLFFFLKLFINSLMVMFFCVKVWVVCFIWFDFCVICLLKKWKYMDFSFSLIRLVDKNIEETEM